MESVKLLVHYGCSIIARARGTFFLPSDIQNGSATKENTSFQSTAYYGEYPLAFAASLGLMEMYDFFIRQSELNPRLGKVHPDAQDSFGNTVLHMCVIYKQKVRNMMAYRTVLLRGGVTISGKIKKKITHP